MFVPKIDLEAQHMVQKGVRSVSDATRRQQRNAWFQNRSKRQKSARIFFLSALPNRSFQATVWNKNHNKNTDRITHVRRKHQEAAVPTARDFLLLCASWEVKRAKQIVGNSSITFLPCSNILSSLVLSFLKWSSCVWITAGARSGPSHPLSQTVELTLPEVETRCCDITLLLLLLPLASCLSTVRPQGSSGIFLVVLSRESRVVIFSSSFFFRS